MQHLQSLQELNLPASWVTIGSFDGVHLGHQALINALVAGAHSIGLPAVVVTFYPHPVVVLRGITPDFYLTLPDERAALLGALGVDYTVTLPFTRELAAQSAEEFIYQIMNALHMQRLHIGENFALGRGRLGNAIALAELGRQTGFDVSIQPLINLNPTATNGDTAISSSKIRQLLTTGQPVTAAQLLGRPYTLSGKIVHGDARGRTLGIRTANLAVPLERLIPAHGVYATWAVWQGQRIPSVTNIGVRPTFENQPPQPRIEAHLLDFDADLYDQTLTLELMDFIRPEQRFSSVTELINQIERDKQTAREVLIHDQDSPSVSA